MAAIGPMPYTAVNTLFDAEDRLVDVVAGEVVREHVTVAFARYGLPQRILVDNGPPGGTAGASGLSALEAEWLQLGIAVSHGRPYHPQTQGKLERLHRTLWAEVVGIRGLPDLATALDCEGGWRRSGCVGPWFSLRMEIRCLRGRVWS